MSKRNLQKLVEERRAKTGEGWATALRQIRSQLSATVSTTIPSEGAPEPTPASATIDEQGGTGTPRTVWCPYTDSEIPIEETTPEHIISLALGGHNGLTLPVHGPTNSSLGSEIDGALAKEFHIARQRAKLDVRGHSGREPTQRFTKVKDRKTGKPLQINWGKRLEVYDPIARQPVNGPVDFELTTYIDATIRMRFLAKCFLSAGYRVYGDLFRRAVEHGEPRLLMKRKAQELTQEELASIRTRLFTWYSGEPGDPRQAEEFNVQQQICSAIKGSLLVFMPGPKNLGFFGGVLGQYLGMMNVPADTTDFPRTDKHDMGFAIIVANGKLMSGSYRTLLRRLIESMPPEVRAASGYPIPA